ncbi:hypothetical protein PC116_g16304 [Phytophthora cactorum]|uniref:Uncharacterized protein n=1 Tax=Phytophthora cactorum TaxID=29920 RepID=A0A8T1KFT6_9STRA|nr:hypothetical protein PC115_g11905 [Phytophthora cactorum]KAG2923590.1 hypothetical protein PC114_g4766 [Phytophthora cactorum]KAG2932261.1 hypothetical protein PC117_g13201 [Phytophthora cactorum]KAG3010513.1 hypothetical protein PC119_g13490 [Phytophthora cactorum]KAG3158842.1 hypothetical protein C6341_g14286 [Phytophthora cactorum]
MVASALMSDSFNNVENANRNLSVGVMAMIATK